MPINLQGLEKFFTSSQTCFLFVRQSLREGGIPFEVRLEQPNKETVAAMLEAERIAKDPSVKSYNDLDELFADLKR